MERFLLRQFAYEPESRPDIIARNAIFFLNLFEAHAAGQAPHNHRNGQAGASNHRFPVTNPWIDNDTIWCSHGTNALSYQYLTLAKIRPAK